MKNNKTGITILHSYDTMPLFYSLFPFLRKKFEDFEFKLTGSVDYCLNKDKNKYLIITRIFNKPPWKGKDLTPTLDLLRKKYKGIAWFNDEDGTNIRNIEVFPFIDLYFKKQIYKDRSLYQKKIYNNLYADYYHKEYQVEDGEDLTTLPIPEERLSKITLAWNIGVGCYPRKNLLRRVGLVTAKYLSSSLVSYFYTDPSLLSVPKNSQMHDVHARFNFSRWNTASFQRKLILEKVSGDGRFLTEPVGSKKYQEEIRNSKIVLSPFGLGEVCFRDFEAILGGALILKPDMSHIETWPDVFRPYETYVPLKWDMSDLMDKADYYLENEDERRKIASRAFEVYQEELDKLDDKVLEMLEFFTK